MSVKIGKVVNLSTAAKIFGYSRRNLDRFRQQPGFPVIEDNQRRNGREVLVSAPQLCTWLIEYEVKKRGLIPDTAEARKHKKLDEEIRRLKMANETRETQLASTDEFRKINQVASDMLRASFSGLAEELAEGDEALEGKLRHEYQRISNAFADERSKFGKIEAGVIDG